jgi:hypothetical protein
MATFAARTTIADNELRNSPMPIRRDERAPAVAGSHEIDVPRPGKNLELLGDRGDQLRVTVNV